jgi:hypothetical protein
MKSRKPGRFHSTPVMLDPPGHVQSENPNETGVSYRFSLRVHRKRARRPSSVAAADFDGNGNIDLAGKLSNEGGPEQRECPVGDRVILSAGPSGDANCADYLAVLLECAKIIIFPSFDAWIPRNWLPDCECSAKSLVAMSENVLVSRL